MFYMNFLHETQQKLDSYESLLLNWNKKINLIGYETRKNIWERHFLDSAQLFYYIPKGVKKILDIGSGAGFPGLILSVLGVKGIILLDKSSKKCIFLKELSRSLNISIKIECFSVEKFFHSTVDVIVSRAFSSLSKLLNVSYPFLFSKTLVLCMKGKNYYKELEDARKKWTFYVKLLASQTNCYSKIIQLHSINKKSFIKNS